MANLEKEADSILSPLDALSEELKIPGTDNDLEHNQFIGGDEVDLLNDGVPGYETTGVDGTDDDTEDHLEQTSITPMPKFTP